MANFKTNSLLDVWNAASGFGGQTADYLNQQLQEQENLKFNMMKIQLQKDANDFLLGLQTNNDFKNWPQQVDDFLQKKLGSRDQETLADGRPNPYYCGTSYLGNKVDEYMAEQYSELQNKVAILTLGKIQEQNNVITDDTVALVRQTAAPVEALAQAASLRHEQYQQGRINDTQLSNYLKEEQVNSVNTELKNRVENIVENYDPEQNIDTLVETLGNNLPDFTVENPATNTPMTIDVTDYVNKAKQNLKPQLKAKLQDYQEKNEQKLSSIFQEMNAADDMETRVMIAEQGQDLLRKWDGTNKVSIDTANQYSSYFKNVLKAASGDAKEKDKIKAMESFWKVEPTVAIQAYINGSLYKGSGLENAYVAQEYLYKAAVDQMQKLNYSEEDINEELRTHNTILDTLAEKAVQAIIGKDSEIENRVNKWLKDQTKNCDPEQVAYFIDWYKDTVAEMDMSKTSSAELSQIFDDMLNTMTSMQIDFLETNKKGKLKHEIKTDKDIGDIALTLSQYDMAYTDIKGRDVWFTYKGNNARTVLEAPGGFIEKGKQLVAEAFGFNAKDITYDFERTNYDLNSTPVFTTPRGADAKIVAVDKDGIQTTDPKKVAGYSVVYLNDDGKQIDIRNEIKTTKGQKSKAKAEKKTSREIDDGRDFIVSDNKNVPYKAVRRYIENDYQNESDWAYAPPEEKKRALEKTGYFKNRAANVEEAKNLKWSKELEAQLPDGITEAQWDNADPVQRMHWLDQVNWIWKSNK